MSKLKATITRTPLRDKQLAMMTKFPHLVRVLHGCFTGEKRAAIPWVTIIEKVVESRCLAEGMYVWKLFQGVYHGAHVRRYGY